jgi:hypothetical protein
MQLPRKRPRAMDPAVFLQGTLKIHEIVYIPPSKKKEMGST